MRRRYDDGKDTKKGRKKGRKKEKVNRSDEGDERWKLDGTYEGVPGVKVTGHS